jgi:hypothetical protein
MAGVAIDKVTAITDKAEAHSLPKPIHREAHTEVIAEERFLM